MVINNAQNVLMLIQNNSYMLLFMGRNQSKFLFIVFILQNMFFGKICNKKIGLEKLHIFLKTKFLGCKYIFYFWVGCEGKRENFEPFD